MENIRDCHYCCHAMAFDATGFCLCFEDSNGGVDIGDTKSEAKNCDCFEYDGCFPKN